MKIEDTEIMPFGKHKGKKLANVPADYLLWLYDNDKCYGTIRQYIQENEVLLRDEIDCDATESDIY